MSTPSAEQDTTGFKILSLQESLGIFQKSRKKISRILPRRLCREGGRREVHRRPASPWPSSCENITKGNIDVFQSLNRTPLQNSIFSNVGTEKPITELNALDGLERRCSLTLPLNCDDEVLPASICMSAVASSSPAVTFFCDGQICHWIGVTTTRPRNVMLS